MPNTPQHAAGIRIEPIPSLPCATGTRPAATAAAEPPDDPPGVRLRSHGLWVMPKLESVAPKTPSSGTPGEADDERPGGAQPLHDGVVARAAASAEVAADPCRHRLAGDRHVVLDRDRDAGQRQRPEVGPRGHLRRLVGDGPRAHHLERAEPTVVRDDRADAGGHRVHR